MIPASNEQKSVKTWSVVLLGMACFAEVCQLCIFGESYFFRLFRFEYSFDSVLNIGFIFAAAFGFFWIAGWLPFSQKEKIISLLLGVCLVLAVYYWKRKLEIIFNIHVFLVPGGFYLVIKALVSYARSVGNSIKSPQWVETLGWLVCAMIGMATATNSMLQVSAVIFPLTYDLHLYKIDVAYGGLAQWVAMVNSNSPVWVQNIVTTVYAMLSMLFFPIIAVLIKEKKIERLHGWRSMIVPFFIAWLCYTWIPATSPIMAFGPANFPLQLPNASELTAGLLSVAPNHRNAMPSMHFSGAFWILMMAAALRKKYLFTFSCFFLAITAWATLALGEHYFIDLVVAFPFAVFLGVILISPPGWNEQKPIVKCAHFLCGVVFFVWILLIKIVPEWLQVNLLFIRIFSIFGSVLAFFVTSKYINLVFHEEKVASISINTDCQSLGEKIHRNYWLVAVFFFSGFAGLAYEVVYAKALAVTFGGTALASNTVLATYMGGMAIGAWLGGVIADRTSKPVFLYAIFEAVIGIYAAITPFLFKSIEFIYVSIALDSPPDAAWLTVMRVILGAIILGIPTVLMGATLPLMFKQLRNMGVSTSHAIAPLYTANVLGAAFGALITGYVLLSTVGRTGTTLLAATISLMVALYVLDRLKHDTVLVFQDNFNQLYETSVAAKNLRQQISENVSDRLGYVALIALLLGGAVTLSLEVTFIHLLAVVAGNSVYAFGLMLATFLMGLGLGSAIGEKMLIKLSRTNIVVIAQTGIAASIIATSFVWDGLASYMGSFVYASAHGIHLGFAGRELIRALVCAIAMLPSALFIGLSYPALTGIATDWLAKTRGVTIGLGLASGINTVGNILGVLVTGFFFLPAFGSRDILFGLVILCLMLAIAIFVAGNYAKVILQHKGNHTVEKIQYTPLLLILSVVIALPLFPKEWDYTALSQGGNVYFYPQFWGKVIDHSESVEGGLTAVAENDAGYLTLLTNGKFQGNNVQGGEMIAQESIGLVPLLHTDQRNTALVIGYGTGMTARVLHEQGFQELDVAELSRDIVEMADKYFHEINHGILKLPNVHMYFTDGRNFLLTQSKLYDLISLEISSIWFAGAANLYNKEFYDLANHRLQKNGILQQWVQLHHMRPIDFLYILGSVRSVFKYVWIYMHGGQGIIIASNGSVDNVSAIDFLKKNANFSTSKINDLESGLIAGPEQIDFILKKYDATMNFFVSTDNNLYLEYATPKGNAIRFDTVRIITDMLQEAR